MESLCKSILENINIYIIVIDINNNIIYKNNDYVINLYNINKTKQNKISYNNNIYDVQYISLNQYNIEIYKDITKYENEIEKLKKDYLTNLYNRYAIFEEIENIKNSSHNFAVIMSDIDFFKNINDKYGHLVGDYVLKGISDILIKNIQNDGIVGRYGGEEFIIVIPNISNNRAFELIEKIRKQIESTKIKVKYNNCIKEFYVTMTFGISISNQKDNIEDLISKADQALYRGKKNGRNQTNIF